MSDLEKNLIDEFQDPDYRYAYAQSFLNTKLATQIKTLREQREKTQVEVSALMGIKQPGYRRFEDVNHDVWKTDSLWSVAKAYGVRLNISFETFGSLLDEKKHFSKKALKRPDFEHDPVFKKQSQEPGQAASATAQTGLLKQLAVGAGLKTSTWVDRLRLAEQAMSLGSGGITLQQMAGGTAGQSTKTQFTPEPKPVQSAVENTSAPGATTPPVQFQSTSPTDIGTWKHKRRTNRFSSRRFQDRRERYA